MANEVVARIISIAAAEESDGYVIEFWVGQELDGDATLSQAFALLNNPDGLQRSLYSMFVQWEDDELVMEPDEALGECLAVFDEYEARGGLEPPLDRQWKTGQIAEAIVTNLVSANVFGTWRTGEDLEAGGSDLDAPPGDEFQPISAPEPAGEDTPITGPKAGELERAEVEALESGPTPAKVDDPTVIDSPPTDATAAEDTLDSEEPGAADPKKASSA